MAPSMGRQLRRLGGGRCVYDRRDGAAGLGTGRGLNLCSPQLAAQCVPWAAPARPGPATLCQWSRSGNDGALTSRVLVGSHLPATGRGLPLDFSHLPNSLAPKVGERAGQGPRIHPHLDPALPHCSPCHVGSPFPGLANYCFFPRRFWTSQIPSPLRLPLGKNGPRRYEAPRLGGANPGMNLTPTSAL